MRSDENLKNVHTQKRSLADFGNETPRNSFSGGERDNLFLSDRCRQFHDVAGVAGLDDPGDGRTSSLLDYDRDGWVDLLVASNTEPVLQLYRNRLGEERFDESRGQRMVAVRVVGGNRTAAPSDRWSAREGYGSRVNVDLGEGQPLVREIRCGDGRATQNSGTLLIGIGTAETVGVEITFPGGVRHATANVSAGTLVTVFEDPSENGGEPFRLERYREARTPTPAGPERRPILGLSLPNGDSVPRLQVLTAMSTHCKSCKKAQPTIAELREAFGADEVGFYGVPVDLDESRLDLDAYVEKYRPSYDVLSTLSLEDRRTVKELITSTWLDEVTPATFVTDAQGRILAKMQGVPNVSQLRKLLASTER